MCYKIEVPDAALFPVQRLAHCLIRQFPLCGPYRYIYNNSTTTSRGDGQKQKKITALRRGLCGYSYPYHTYIYIRTTVSYAKPICQTNPDKFFCLFVSSCVPERCTWQAVIRRDGNGRGEIGIVFFFCTRHRYAQIPFGHISVYFYRTKSPKMRAFGHARLPRASRRSCASRHMVCGGTKESAGTAPRGLLVYIYIATVGTVLHSDGPVKSQALICRRYIIGTAGTVLCPNGVTKN